MRVIYNRNGLNGYFNGNLTNCIRIFPQSAIQWSTFNYSRSHLENVIKNTTFTNFISGGIAGMVSYGIIYPLETIRSKLSVQNKDTKLYNGIVDCFTKSIRVNGFRSLYNGCGLSLLGQIPFQGSNFVTYYYLKDNYNTQSNKYISLIHGSIAGFVSVSLTYPFDTIKRRLQLSGEYGNPKYTGIRHCIKYIVNTYGIRGLFRGLIPAYIKILPSNGLYFWTLELLHELYK